MKTATVLLLALLGAGQSPAQPTPANGRFLFEGHVNCPAVSTSGGHVFLRLSIAPQGHPHADRRPLNLSIVLDRSGSMSEESKMSFAKAALITLVDQLRSDDLFSMVIYDDVVDVLRPAARVGGDKERIRCLVSDIEPRGSTNLGGGMAEGFRQVEKSIDKEYVNRVILLSDGLANQGITDPARLENLAQRQRERSISLSTIGVGLDYNENLMEGLSESGGGNYYFLESSYNLASVFRKEFDRMSEVVAQNVSIELQLGKGVTLLDAIGYECKSHGSMAQIPIGDVYANETRDVILELNVAPGSGTLELAQGKLVRGGASARLELGSCINEVNYESDPVAIEHRRDLREQSKAEVAVSTRDVAKAMEALDKGDKEEASQILRSAGAGLLNSPAAAMPGQDGAAVRSQAEKIRGYADTLKNDTNDARRAKKSIQYDNYRQQKTK